MIVIEKEVFRLPLPMDEKNWSRFSVVLTREMQGGNINASRSITERLLYLFILPRNEGLQQKMQTTHTDTLN